MTVLVVGVIRVFLVAVIFVVLVGCDLFAGGLFGEEFSMESVSVSDVGLVGGCFNVVFFVSVCSQQVVFGSEFKVVGRFTVRVGCGH